MVNTLSNQSAVCTTPLESTGKTMCRISTGIKSAIFSARDRRAVLASATCSTVNSAPVKPERDLKLSESSRKICISFSVLRSEAPLSPLPKVKSPIVPPTRPLMLSYGAARLTSSASASTITRYAVTPLGFSLSWRSCFWKGLKPSEVISEDAVYSAALINPRNTSDLASGGNAFKERAI